MNRDEILAAIEQAHTARFIPSLGAIAVRMAKVDELADEYMSNETGDVQYLTEALLTAHKQFAEWVNAYA